MRYEKILVVAAHPDDEMLGCGGNLARFSSEGATVRILLLGEGPLARDYSTSDVANVKDDAITSALRASEILGIKDVRFGNLPDNKFGRFEHRPLRDTPRCFDRFSSSAEHQTLLNKRCANMRPK